MKEIFLSFFKTQNIEFFTALSINSLPSELIIARKRLPEWAKSAIVFLIPYGTGQEKRNVSAYAVPVDYHFYVKELSEKLKAFLQEKHINAKTEIFADTSPFDERKLALICGLGTIGKNGLIINKKYGSCVFVAEIVTDSEEVACLKSQPFSLQKSCAECGMCKKACPANNGECMSAVTQKKELTTEENRKILCHSLLWGCDICQEVCPHNKNAQKTPIEFFKRDLVPYLSVADIYGMEREEFARRAYSWRGKEVILRNAVINYIITDCNGKINNARAANLPFYTFPRKNAKFSEFIRSLEGHLKNIPHGNINNFPFYKEFSAAPFFKALLCEGENHEDKERFFLDTYTRLLPFAITYLQSIGVDREIISDTLNAVFDRAREYFEYSGKTGLSDYRFCVRNLCGAVFKIGSFEFEPCSNTFEGIPYLSEGDLIIKLHAPRGCDLSAGARYASYKRACEFFFEKFGVKKLVFACESWLLCRDNEALGQCNINSFRGDFKIFSEYYDKEKEFLRHIFGNADLDCPEKLPNTTRVMRLYKQKLINGEKFGTACGYFEASEILRRCATELK